MFYQRIKKLAVLATVAIVFCAGLFSNAVYADGDPDYRMQISPIKNAIKELKPGEEYRGRFEVTNRGAKAIDFKVEGAPYSVSNQNYDPDFSTKNAYTELNEWMTVTPSEGEVAPGESIEVEYVINVPEDAHGGQQNAAIIVQATNLDDNGGSAVQALNQIAFVIYSNIQGDVKETGVVLENNVPGFLLGAPMTVSSLVENTGNVYGEATYKLQVFSLFGSGEVYTNEEEPETDVVFAGTKRYHEMTWEGAPQLGIFRVKQTVKIFDEESEVEKIVLLCPVWFLFVLLLIIFVAIFWIFGRMKGRKSER